MMYFLIPAIIGIALLIAFLFFRVKEKRVIAVFLKGATSLMFIFTGLLALLFSNNIASLFGIFVLIGLFFGLLGDVFLDLKYILLKHEFLFTSLGFISFGLGHIFFISGIFTSFYDFSKNILFIIIPVLVTIVLVVVTLLMEKFTKVRYLKMKPFVIVYGFILFFVTTLAVSTAIQNGFRPVTLNIFFASLISFVLSDLILNNTYFAPGFNKPAYIISNHILYYIAQFGIAISLFFLA